MKMTLEKQIKQKVFESELQKAVVNITFTSNFLTGQMNKLFKPYKVSVQQFNVLRILKGQHPEAVSINDITDRMIDKMSNASRLVEKLRKKGLVDRTTCAFDRRQVDVQLTEMGLARLEELNELVLHSMANYRHISEEEYYVLNELLDRMRNED